MCSEYMLTRITHYSTILINVSISNTVLTRDNSFERQVNDWTVPHLSTAQVREQV